MEIPRSAEALTKLLRSKDITTGEICEIVPQLDQIRVYFPNKEIFILELIIDRWNDQKRVDFKKDYKIWELFNEMWVALGDEALLKRLLKKLKFAPHLIQALQLVESSFSSFVRALKQTCVLINSLTTVEVTLDSANAIIGRSIDVLLKIPESERDERLRSQFMREVETLVDVRSMSEMFAKSAASYCNHLLLPSLKYFTEFANSLHDTTTDVLTELLGSFVFNRLVDTVKLLDKFVQNKGDQLSAQDCSALFQKCILFLSKEHFKELEKIFSIVVRIHPELSTELLKELSLSKKTMSQEFLQNLFDSTMNTIQQRSADIELWQLIYYILTLDIEIGIKNSNRLLALITEGKTQCSYWSKKLWSELIKCYRNARELPQFLDEIKSYCLETSSSIFLIVDEQFAEKLSESLSSFSTTQLKDIISGILNALEENPADHINGHSLMVILKGLSLLPYTALLEYRTMLGRVFNLKVDDQLVCWKARYLVMDIFDDIIPKEILEAPDSEVKKSNISGKSPMDLFYYLFKVREYKAFDILPVVDAFMEKICSLPVEEQAGTLNFVFNNWGTMISSLFPKNEVERLVQLIFTGNNIPVLNIILSNDGIFEEEEIMHFIIWFISRSYKTQEILSSLLKIPIQCINKSVRIDLINKISQNEHLTELETLVLVHLLENATFKSEIEKTWESLQTFIVKKMENLTYQNTVFETIWINHLSQQKESISMEFIQTGIDFLCDKLLTQGFEPSTFQTAFLVLKTTARLESPKLLDTYVERVVDVLSESGKHQDTEVISWLLRSLYYVLKDSNRSLEGPSRHSLCNFIKDSFSSVQKTDDDLLTSMFLLYSTLYSEELEYLFAQFMVLRSAGIEAAIIAPGVEAAIKSSLRRDVTSFNRAFVKSFESFEHCSPELTDGLLELYQIQINLFEKDNSAAEGIFLNSISSLYTHQSKFIGSPEAILKTLKCIGELLISKPWLFSQYCIEMLFPMCLQMNLAFMGSDVASDQIFLSTTKILSNIFFTHRIKLSNRHHIVVTYLCESLELLSAHKDTKLTPVSAKALARLITNLCEPNISLAKKTSGKSRLSSRTGEMKNSLRKHVPVLLVRYVHLSVTSPFDARTRNELTTAVYSIFDLLSQDGLSLANEALDYAGRQYLRGLYADYKKFGKWHAD